MRSSDTPKTQSSKTRQTNSTPRSTKSTPTHLNPPSSGGAQSAPLLPSNVGVERDIRAVRKYSVVNPEATYRSGWEDDYEADSKHAQNLLHDFLVFGCYLLVILTFPISLLFCFKIVTEYERAVILRLGRLLKDRQARGPGIFFVLPCLDQNKIVDLRTITFDVPTQEVLTKDSVTVAVDAVVNYRIYNPVVAVMNVENCDESTRLLAAASLRNVLGMKDLAEILSDRESISNLMQYMLDDATHPWGVKVERVEVKDVRLPVELQRAMAAEAEAAREARAKVMAAEGEEKSSFALLKASETIQRSPIAIQLRYLQTLSAISAEKNSTILFPIPIDFFGPPSRSRLQHNIKT